MNKSKIIIPIAILVSLSVAISFWFKLICNIPQETLVSFGTYIGGIFGPIITAATLWFIWRQSREDRVFSKRSLFLSEILNLFNRLYTIEAYYLKHYQDVIQMNDLNRKLHKSHVSEEQAQQLKNEMDLLVQKYKAEQTKTAENIPQLIQRSLTESKIIFGVDSMEYLVPFLEMAKSVNHRLTGSMIGDGGNIFFDQFHFSFLKRLIYKDTFSKYFGDKKLKYDNWLDFAKTDLEKIKKKIDNTSL